MPFRKIAFLMVAGATLAGCGGSPAVDNPDFFSFRSRDGVLSGTYNPAGYSSAEIQAEVKTACASNRLATYGEAAPTKDGLVAFTATCDGALKYGTGAFEVQKAAGGS